MMRSMFSGVSGLRVHQTKMDVIGNNIANVNTVGFKSSRVTFSEVFYQTVQGASGANAAAGVGGRNPMQIGLGVNLASISNNMSEGAAQRTDDPFDLKIKGEGFFIVRDTDGFKFTRAGAFTIDNAGNLVNTNGLMVMGYKANATGEIQKGTVEPLDVMSPENTYSAPIATTAARMIGNIEMTDPQVATTATGSPFSFAIYDSLGYSYDLALDIKKTGASDYDYTVSAASLKDSNGNPVTGFNASTHNFTFDPVTGKIDSTGLMFDLVISDGNGSLPENIMIDLSALTLFDTGKATAVQGLRGDKAGLDGGRKVGELAGLSVGGDGKIQGRYTNGETKILGQIALANFANPAGMEKVGDNLFIATMNSGDFDGIGSDPLSNGGGLQSGVLEMSNVDLSQEFTEMITTQRGFQANSRIITASDEMLQELVNLKR